MGWSFIKKILLQSLVVTICTQRKKAVTIQPQAEIVKKENRHSPMHFEDNHD